MKHKIQLLTWVLLTLGILAPLSAQNRGALKFDVIEKHHNYNLTSATLSPKYKHEMHIKYALDGDKSVKDFVNSQINGLVLGSVYKSIPTPQAIDNYLDEKTKLYLKDIKREYDEDRAHTAISQKDLISRYSYSIKYDTDILGYWNCILTYKFNWYDSKYGSTGIIGTTYMNLDLYNFKLLEYQDIFIPSSKETITQLVKKEILKQIGANSNEEAENKGYQLHNLEPSAKFVLKPDGVYFVYEPHELQSHEREDLIVHLSYAQLKKYMNANNTAIRMIIPR